MTKADEPVLAIEDLVIEIGGDAIVDRVSLSVDASRILAIVGESGSGKSLTALSVLGLLPAAARVARGAVRLRGRDLTHLDEDALAQVRGNDATIIFQEPIASLNPLMRVGEQVEEALKLHRGMSRREARAEAVAMMARVGIPDPERRARQYPFELSGGMCQRIMIAAALICRPALLIADEPTTALDVTIQAQILDLMRRLRDEVGAAIILITHDMGVVADIADDVCVMYGGRIVERAPVDALFSKPRHPYTKLLLATIPTLEGARKTTLRTIEGMVPTADAWPSGCRFRTRCPLADDVCAAVPPLDPVAPEHFAACWRSDRVEALA
ncbi:MAG: peptide ABC transporter ATP-binding protein [Rhizobiales bacterium 65-9]|nr:ABC transporter ATP-binding protein [Hyphomicrobiales bacterium]OJY32438.1 MAG: peptide ABC transporter ATP-binding protein [Rhizobiales bacterium 65-9]